MNDRIASLEAQLSEQTRLAENYKTAWLQLLTLWQIASSLLQRAIRQIQSRSDFTSKEELVAEIKRFINENNDTKKAA